MSGRWNTLIKHTITEEALPAEQNCTRLKGWIEWLGNINPGTIKGLEDGGDKNKKSTGWQRGGREKSSQNDGVWKSD